MNPTDQIPIHHLWDKYAFNPLTGALYSLEKQMYVKGKTTRYAQKMRVHWNGHIYGTTYGRVVFAWIYQTWPLQIKFKNGNPKDCRLINLRSA